MLAGTAIADQQMLTVLKEHWGFNAFRPQQREAVTAVLKEQDCLVVVPTGGGKSLCYQLPALVRGQLTVVVSPLIALMDDQVAAAGANGIAAAALHSQRDEGERARALIAARNGELRLLYVSPERLAVGDVLPSLAAQLCLVAVDEAHCVSHWGHDFRPEYRQIAAMCAAIPDHVPRMALTATATPMVQDDIVAHLGLRQPQRLIGHPDRPNLIYRALPRSKLTDQVCAVAERHPEGGGIVYALTRKEVEKIAADLAQRGLRVAAYHAGMEADQRREVQRGFVAERIAVVVATIAFGMGIDRSNVRWVVHAGSPRSLEHYQQESGRAGRDGLPAECILLFGSGDLSTHRYFLDRDNPPPERRAILEDQLRAMARFATAPVCRHRLLSTYFGADYPAPGVAVSEEGCGACDICLGETVAMADADALVLARKIISAVWRLGGRFGINHVIAVLLGRNTEAIRRNEHNALSVYGLLKEWDEWSLRRWIDQLIVQEHLANERSDGFPLLTMTHAGKALCAHGEGVVRLTNPALGKRSESRSGRKSHDVDAEAWEGVDRALFDVLRSMRATIASNDGVPPYIVFHDAALRELARHQPTELWLLAEIKGIGDRKCERYGDTVIKTIRAYQNSK